MAPVVDNSTYPSGSIGAPEKISSDSINEVLSRLEQMQQEIQSLRGGLEEQSEEISKLNKRQNNIYSDLDRRLEKVTPEISNNKIVVPQVIQNIAPTKAPSTLVPIAQAKTTTPQVAITSEKIVPKAKPAALSPEPVAVSTPPKRTKLTSSKDQKELYQHAYEMLRNGHNIQAIEGFNELLTLYPNGKFASNSQYWLGEAYKVTHNLEAAKIAFTKVVESYGKSYKVPDALLKLGYIELEQGNKAKAKALLTRISRRYPNTTVAHLAKKKLLQLEGVSP